MAVQSRLDLESLLNPEQLAAVTHGAGPQLVLAGAGSGKTRVITYRIAWLVHECDVDPGSIVAVTFTNKAAGEMKERVEQLLQLYPLPSFVGTFHRFALRLLRRHGARVGLAHDFTIFDSGDQISLIKKALEVESLSESAFAPRAVLSRISGAKNRLIDPNVFETEANNFFDRQVARVYRRYQGMLRENSGLDFDDMLLLAVRLVSEESDLRSRLRDRIAHLLVDEFQDTNHAQMRFIQELVGAAGNLTAVGDEDQGIYRWRGADLDNVLNFERVFTSATVRTLERNYRSTQNILRVSGDLVEHNEHRHGKRLWTDAGDGEPVELYKGRDEQDEANWIANTFDDLRSVYPLSDMAILVRTNAQTRAFEEEFLRRQMPYELVGGIRFYERAEIKDLVAYLRFLRNPLDNYSLLRILNKPARGIGKATQELITQEAAAMSRSLWEAICHMEMASLPARSAKALEGFRSLILGLREDAEISPLPILLEKVIERTDYLSLYKADDPEGESKRENIREFLTAALEFSERAEWSEETDLLTAFLDHVSLVTDIDEWSQERGVSLMTLHSAKGLEFAICAIAGLEDGLLPHFNSGDSQEDLEEERRLLYVGMTRAKQRLFLSACRRRRIAGRYKDQEESPFLLELPRELLEVTESPELFYDDRSRAALSYFGRSVSPAIPSDSEIGAGASAGQGKRVRHPTLGEGVIMALEGEGESAKVTVFFERVGKRKLVAKYANLEPL